MLQVPLGEHPMSDATNCDAYSEIWGSGLNAPVLRATFTCYLPAGHEGLHQDMSWGVWEESVSGETR